MNNNNISNNNNNININIKSSDTNTDVSNPIFIMGDSIVDTRKRLRTIT